jgi:hypothetical protein
MLKIATLGKSNSFYFDLHVFYVVAVEMKCLSKIVALGKKQKHFNFDLYFLISCCSCDVLFKISSLGK